MSNSRPYLCLQRSVLHLSSVGLTKLHLAALGIQASSLPQALGGTVEQEHGVLALVRLRGGWWRFGFANTGAVVARNPAHPERGVPTTPLRKSSLSPVQGNEDENMISTGNCQTAVGP